METISRVWLDSRQLKQMKEQITFVASDTLKSELDKYLTENQGDGGYLGNVFSNYSLVEIKRLNDNVGIMPLNLKL